MNSCKHAHGLGGMHKGGLVGCHHEDTMVSLKAASVHGLVSLALLDGMCAVESVRWQAQGEESVILAWSWRSGAAVLGVPC